MEWLFYNKDDIEDIKKFLYKNNNIVEGIPLTSLSGGIEGLLHSGLNYGNILLYKNYQNKKIYGVCVFTYGDSNEDFKDKHILYVLLAAILPSRRGQSFKKLVKTILRECEDKNITYVRFKSPLQNEKNNKLYDKVAQRKKTTTNLTGHRSILYEVNLKSWKTKIATFFI